MKDTSGEFFAWSEKKIVENEINYIASSNKIFSAGRPLINKQINKKMNKYVNKMNWESYKNSNEYKSKCEDVFSLSNAKD